LFNESQAAPLITRGSPIGFLVTRTYDYANLLDSGAGHFLQDDLKGGLRRPIPVNQGLEWQSSLGLSGCGDDRFLDFHK
jgi:hypothetical protein